MSIESDHTLQLSGLGEKTNAVRSIRRAIVAGFWWPAFSMVKGLCCSWSADFISLEAAKPMLHRMAGSLLSELEVAGPQDEFANLAGVGADVTRRHSLGS